MVAQEFLSLIDQFKLSSYAGLEDFADRLNFIFSVVILSLSMVIVTAKAYFFKPLSCYVATTPSGMNFDGYMENYCWVHGTIPFLENERIPDKPEDWAIWDADKRITYYQWVPFILGLQCILFYIPKLLWEIICYNKLGTNLETLITAATDSSKLPPSERKSVLNNIVRIIEDLLYQHRDYRQGKMAKARRRIYEYCNFCVFSKHLGTWLVSTYFFIKCLYGINVIGQLYLMKSFLGFNSSMSSFGYTILNDIISGKSWHETRNFPRVSYCYNADIKHLGAVNTYVAQCTLPVNMLNEKIYIFLWFWVLLVGIITLLSILQWVVRIVFLSKRSMFAKKLLKMHQSYQRSENLTVNHFIKEYLRYDGLFLIRMIYINSGDIVAAEILNGLWETYKNKYINHDFTNYNNYEKLISGRQDDKSFDNTLKNDSNSQLL